ncbi:MAG TPA: glycogen synthase [Spirochaetota bacterium]|nr:glycogen synthase [Spirochaetota bacterium]
MRIAFITPEAYPFVKTGGLADVAHSLPRAMARLGHDVRLVIPRYYRVDKERFGLKLVPPPLGVPLGSGEKWAAVYESRFVAEVPAYFIEHDNFFGRDGLYDDGYGAYADNGERFAFFCRAALQALKALDFRPDIIHCNDWQTGLAPVYLRTAYARDAFFRGAASVITVHNVGYQGVFPDSMMECALLGREHFHSGALEYFGQVNFLKGGLVFSDAVTTVSRRYAGEIQTPEFGYNLAGVFASLGGRLYGITNGVDYGKWEPSTDARIPARYSADELAGKIKCRKALQRRFNLPAQGKDPIVGTVSRLTYQKGMDVLAEALFLLMRDRKFQFVLLGSGEDGIIRRFEELRRAFPDRVGLFWGYDEELAHLVEAGIDIYAMPSRYEPCGLNQMYSLRYGSVPVVRATGGLDDTVMDEFAFPGKGTGFKFSELTPAVLADTFSKVFRAFRDKAAWGDIVRRGMAVHYSWDDAAREYGKVYGAVLAGRK